MSDESLQQPEDAVSRAELENIQEQLRILRAERDRQNFEKAEIVAKANAYAKERDQAKEELASVLSERDQMIGDVVSDHEKKIADLISERDRLAQEKASATSLVQSMTRLADDAKRRADEAAEEIVRLRAIVDNAPKQDPVALLLALATEKTKALVAWVRGKIPADSAILPWFDKTVETVTALGCAAVKLTREFLAWATPRVIALSKQGVAKVEELLAKK
ncbi:hypothetical protein AMST5_02759 [freshwater sediment metagenome]|jgi:uncharacterized coiled-coil DUF342 family protein|uniref:Uncharacterized protein n=1 Tax=freshwater sediment metagenome TaxID=556182 RepID=A0AA48M0M7_9ZZZZ